MRRLITFAALMIAATASAQVPPAELGQRNVPAPWWMREPVIASIGSVRTELTANRASFSAEFSAVDRDVATATAKATDKIRAIDAALRALGADRASLRTTVSTTPLYEQYRDKDGNLQANERADKIERYEAKAMIDVDVRDLRVLEGAYAAVVEAQPNSIEKVEFSLQPDNETKSELAVAAVADATRRARESVAAAGARLGLARIIDPTGRVCRTDVLAGWQSYGSTPAPTDVNVRSRGANYDMASPVAVVTGSSLRRPPLQVTLQPTREYLTETACVIFALLP